jgi:hypothetical protein
MSVEGRVLVAGQVVRLAEAVQYGRLDLRIGEAPAHVEGRLPGRDRLVVASHAGVAETEVGQRPGLAWAATRHAVQRERLLGVLDRFGVAAEAGVHQSKVGAQGRFPGSVEALLQIEGLMGVVERFIIVAEQVQLDAEVALGAGLPGGVVEGPEQAEGRAVVVGGFGVAAEPAADRAQVVQSRRLTAAIAVLAV